MSNETYNPNALLDAVSEKLGAKNDAALARALEVAPPMLSRIRHNKLPVGASLLVAMHELTGASTRDLRALMGDRRQRFRAAGVGKGWAKKGGAA
jgi:hypothetical protein